jgi:hypothetical protein
MQDFIDQKYEEIKILANFDLTLESEYLKMSVYDFYFHVWVKSNQKDNN